MVCLLWARHRIAADKPLFGAYAFRIAISLARLQLHKISHVRGSFLCSKVYFV